MNGHLHAEKCAWRFPGVGLRALCSPEFFFLHFSQFLLSIVITGIDQMSKAKISSLCTKTHSMVSSFDCLHNSQSGPATP